MREFPKNVSFPEAQAWVAQMCKERGFENDSPEELFLLFTEEIGELAKAIRRVRDLHARGNRSEEEKQHNLREEFADVTLFLLDLANNFSVNIEEAIREKEKINNTRTWK